ncbi:MAG TPA: hypothetical protein VER08_01145 [Pyrinomonadaceae bacterium]|nr:hypothetical protein [Pyrinomonadaceae bacterium]
MSKLIKRELWLAAQFFAFAAVACVGAFLDEFGPAEPGTHVNLAEAWRNVSRFVGSVLLIFAALAAARMALVLAASKLPPRHD